MVDVKDILRKHAGRIEQQMGGTVRKSQYDYSKEYTVFKEEMAPQLTRYEKLCRSLGSVIKLKPSTKDEMQVRKDLTIAHLDTEPWQALTLSVVGFLGVFFLGIFISLAVWLIGGSFPFSFLILTIIISLFLFSYLRGYPKRLANRWRLKASSQMVPAILYVVVYMRHTPNLEKAIAFASEHLQYPLALDFRKVFYDMQVGKFSTIKESLDNYLEVWRDYSPEFIEGFHLIESSLFEPEEARRIQTLEKALQVVLDGVYDSMLKFTHNVKAPLTNVYMLGIVLPILGVAMLPLASALIGDLLRANHVFMLYNLIIPFVAFFMLNKILLLRPGGYGETSLLERNPLYPKFKSRKPYYKAALIAFPFIIIGLLPFIFQYTFVPDLLGLQKDYTFTELGLGFFGNSKIFDFKPVGDGFAGPFGILALLFSLSFTLGVMLFFSISFAAKTNELMVERRKTRALEKEFNNSLFQLGNRLGNGMPPELVFAKVAESSKGLKTEDFFRKVNYNIQQMGMSVESAIFDPNRGALRYYPSNLIATSMKVMVESVKKGLAIAATSLMSISQYVKNIQKITLRLKDILAEIVSDMRSSMTFLTPLLAGVVIGLAAMITSILNSLEQQLAGISAEGAAGLGNIGTITGIFEVVKMVPPYYLQISIGLFLIQIVFVLTSALVSVDSGEDKLEKMHKTGKNIRKAVILYLVVSVVTITALFLLSSVVLGGLL